MMRLTFKTNANSLVEYANRILEYVVTLILIVTCTIQSVIRPHFNDSVPEPADFAQEPVRTYGMDVPIFWRLVQMTLRASAQLNVDFAIALLLQ